MAKFVVPLNSAEAVNAEKYGPKAANQAALGQAGLPIPAGFCIGAAAYRRQVEDAGLGEMLAKLPTVDYREARKLTNDIRLALYEQPMAQEIKDEILAARKALIAETGALMVVRSSALIEDREGTSFAGQFESFLGLETEEEFLTTVTACWAALWSVRALRYMDGHDISPADTAMALLVQPLVSAIASGGGLSKTSEGGMRLSATWGLGEAIAQGEVVPDRYELSADGKIQEVQAGRKAHLVGCSMHAPTSKAVAADLVHQRCLDDEQVIELGQLLRKSESVIDMSAEIEWAMDEKGFKLLQVRPLVVEEMKETDAVWSRRPGLRGQPGGIGWTQGRACVVNCECELSRVAPGDVLITTVAGPSLSPILPRVSGVVAELGGSTSHLASLARERGIPMVLGVLDATETIPDGAQVAVDGVAGIVRWVEA